MNLKATLTFIFGSLFLMSQAQNFVMDGTPIDACDGFFVDSGDNMPYGPNENLTTTICADGSGGTHIQLIFNGTELGTGDDICFFDGEDATAPQLTCASEFNGQSSFIIQATAPNTSGCLTVVFTSDAADEGAGWSADINCITACQTIQSVLVSTDPLVEPVDTGWIDICPGDRVFFTGEGFYPQDGLVYDHSDFTSIFEWNFGDGNTSFGPSVSHAYEESGGYIVQLTITDIEGCQNTNFISQRIRVATKPSFNIGGDLVSEICANDTISLNAMVNQMDSTSVVSVTPNQGTFLVQGIRSDSLPLPDGDGSCYSTSIAFNDFSPGQVLTDVNDLESICVIMEHSWMRDLEITLTCPDGTTILLHDHPGQFGGQVYLGEPNDNDGGFPTPGLGYEYCWTPDATNGTWIQYANGNSPGTLPPGDYNTVDPMTDFLGCPLNGEWEITVCDLWASDNGFIFSWGINFNEDLYPNVETFTPNLIDWNWQNQPSIYFQTMDSIMAAPQNAGTASYTFTVEDDFGCVWDTMVNIAVLPYTHPDCYNCEEILSAFGDTTVCEGEPVDIDVFSEVPTEVPVTFESFPNYAFGAGNHPPNNPYASGIQVQAINPAFITNPLVDVVSVCVDITTDFDADIAIYLQSPNGDLLELSTNNGGGGDNYTQTCFTPTATTPIQSGTPPFTGDFMPEGSWNALNGSPINGTWNLLVSDAFAPNVLGSLNWWSITFNSVNEIDYNWTNTASLSCDDCPNPTANPMATTTYTVTAGDSYQCSSSEEIEITVLESFTAPDITCQILGNGELLATWNEVGGGLDYEININGTGWIDPNDSNTSHLFTGLINGDDLDIEVRVKTNGAACDVEIGEEECEYLLCEVVITDTIFNQPACPGDCNSFVQISAFNGQAPFEYFINNLTDGTSNSQNNGALTGLCAGDYEVYVLDMAGCSDTTYFTLEDPDPIVVSITETNALECFGDTDGELTATGTGGVGDYSFAWNDDAGQINSTAVGLSEGIYTVTLTDDNSCVGVGTFVLDQPTELTLMTEGEDVLCTGESTGSAMVVPDGGSGGYTYQWSSGDTPNQSNTDGLAAGLVAVTVFDVNGCSAMGEVTIDEPADGIQLTIEQTKNACFMANDGEALVTAIGGAGGYNYEWSNGSTNAAAIGLIPQNYTVTVTDINGCSRAENIDIQELELVTLSNFNFGLITCHDGDDGAVVFSPGMNTVSGGAGAPYSLLWSTGDTGEAVQNLSAGTYGLTLTDSQGCEGVGFQTLENPDPVTFELEKQDVICNSEATGTATIMNVQANGNTIESYEWNNAQSTATATDLMAGEYTVTITDSNGCTAENAISIEEPTAISIDYDVINAECYGDNNGEITAVPAGGVPGYDFNWATISLNAGKLTDLPADTYFLTLTDDVGCAFIDSVVVEQPDSLSTGTNNFDVSCFGARDGRLEITTFGGTQPYTFSTDGENFFGSSTLIGLEAGQFTVTISDARGCTDEIYPTIGGPDQMVVSILNEDGETIDENPTITFGDSLNVNANVVNNQGFVDYFWSASYCGSMMCPGADTTDCMGAIICENPILMPDNPITYNLVAIDEMGCESSISLVVFVEKIRQVEVPTGFAPNGNNSENFALHVHGKTGTKINVFRVFDRWGEMLYEENKPFDVNNLQVGWDGTFQNKPMPAGVYVWFLEAEFEDGTKEIYKGETTLIR